MVSDSRILIQSQALENSIGSAVSDSNPDLCKRFEKNIRFGFGILIQSQILRGANRKCMLAIEIRIWAKDSKRILSLVQRFSSKVRYWEKPIGNGCW